MKKTLFSGMATPFWSCSTSLKSFTPTSADYQYHISSSKRLDTKYIWMPCFIYKVVSGMTVSITGDVMSKCIYKYTIFYPALLYMSFELFMVMGVQNYKPCSLICDYQHFRRTYCFHLLW